MKHNSPPWRDGPCADNQSEKEHHSYSRSAAGSATLSSSSSRQFPSPRTDTPELVPSAREWLAIHDPDRRESSLRFQRFQQRRRERRKARQQQRMQRRRQLAAPLLRGVK